MNNNSKGLIVAGIALVIAVIALFTPAVHQARLASVGGLTNYDTVGASGLQIGVGCNNSYSSCAGSLVSSILKGTGSIIGNRSVTASTTAAFDIAVTGALSGDACFAMAASTTQAYIGWDIIGCSASTTAGFITISVYNPGAAAVVPYPIASSTSYVVIR